MNPVLDYRPCVGIAVFNREGAVWMGRRASGFGSETDGGDKIWQMPQGGIDKGEEPLAAAMRELYEETGIASATLLGQTGDWLTYDLPDHLIGLALKGRYRGQKQKWFAVRFDGKESEIRIDPPPDGHSAEFSDWRWMALQDVPDEIVPFKRPVYEAMVREFAPFAVPSGISSPG